MAARTRWAARALVLALVGWTLPAAQGRAFDLVRSGSGGGAPGAPASTQAGDAELRAFQRAFRATRDPLEVLPAREAALEALRGDQRPAAARALLEAYADLEREVAPVAERHLAAVSIDQGARNAAALRPELDAQRALQDRLLEALLALEGEGARAWLVEQVVDEDDLPLGLRLACSDLARGLAPSRSLDRGLERALGRARRAPGEVLVALRVITALGPAAAEHERAVIEALEAPSPRVRAAAAGALAALERPAALEPLIEALERERGRNARRMVEALQVLTGQRAGSGAASWRRWLEREGAPFLDGTRPLGGGPATAAADESARYHGIALEGRSILFVLDVSRSMERVLARPDRSAGNDRAGSGEGGRAVRRIDRALEELARALRSLEGVGGDEPVRFGVVAFAGRIETWEDEPVEAEADQLERAIEWVEGLALEHGTSTYGALEVAFQLAGRGAEDVDYEPRYDTLCLLSDGMPRLNGEADSAERIVSAARRWNAAGGLVVHTIGLGDEVPAELMGGLARDSGGRHVLETSAGTVDLSGRPNVVLFVVDDLGWRDVGCAGGELDTPSVDRLAAEGTRFDSAYACGPNCAPGRAGLMTGLYAPRHGIYTVLDPARGPSSERALVPTPSATALRPELSTLAEVLAGAGYATAAIGKWHLGDDPREHGFQHAVAGDAAGHPRSHFSPYANPALEDGPEGEYLTERLTDEALDFVRAHATEPFFLYLSHYAVHAPLQAPEPLRAKHAARLGEGPRATYAAMVESVDASLGRVLDLLAELGLEERTLVLFTSDNGGLAAVSSMAPLRGEKGTLLEAGLRVPLVIRWPGRVGSGAVVSAPVIGCDLMPTVLQLCAVPCPPVDGESLVPLLQGEGGGRGAGHLEREALFWHFPAYLEPHGDGTAFRARPAGAVRRGRFKLIEHFEDGRLELYDLRDDPGETRDLSAERGELRDELHRLLAGWREELDAPVPTERNPDFGR